jgi:hypothetical protein
VEVAQAARKAKPPPAKPPPKIDRGTPRQPAGRKVRNPWLFEKLEAKIIALEEELKTLQEASTTEGVYRNPEKLRETQVRLSEIERDLALANEEWTNWA